MVRLFSGNRASVLLLLPILAGIFFALNYFTSYYIQEETSNLGYWGEAIVIYPEFLSFGGVILVLINAIMINRIFNSNEFLERNSYLSSMLYVVLMSFYHSFYSLDGLLLAHSFLILAMGQFFELNQHSDGRRHVFNGMFFAGLAATFHPPLTAFFPLFCVMIWVVRPFILREFILALMGFGLPLLYAVVYLWVSGHEVELQLLDQVTDYINKQTDFLVTAVLFTLLFILSILSIRSRMLKSSIRLKKLTTILWWFLLMSVILGCVDFFFFRQIERFSFNMIPLSIFLTFAFTNKTFNVFATLLFYAAFSYSISKFFF